MCWEFQRFFYIFRFQKFPLYQDAEAFQSGISAHFACNLLTPPMLHMSSQRHAARCLIPCGSPRSSYSGTSFSKSVVSSFQDANPMTIRVGISVVTHQGQNIWQNGLGQNVIFLSKALQKLPWATRTHCRRKSTPRRKACASCALRMRPMPSTSSSKWAARSTRNGSI